MRTPALGASAAAPLAPDPERTAPYILPVSSPGTDRLLMWAFVILITFTTAEAPLRWATTQVGAAWFIYFRDVAVVSAMLALAALQMRRQHVQFAFVLFAVFLIFHGVVSALLCSVPVALFMGLKTLIYPMFGVIFLPILLKGNRTIRVLLIATWVVTTIGVLLDQAGYSMPWKGLNATVGDYSVVINRKWNFEGEDRLAGFARDSVSAGLMVALPGLYCLLFCRSWLVRLATGVATVVVIYLTTSKGGVLAFALTTLACFMPGQRSQWLNKMLLTLIFLAMMLCPVILPNYSMPRSASAVESFVDRIQRVWPDSWHNIADHSWIFGAGMGNIGVGQQYLGLEGVDTADNLFVLAYGYFGVLSILYLSLPYLAAMCRRTPVDVAARFALMSLLFIYAYGIVANVLESPIAAFMLGAAFQALALKRISPLRQAEYVGPLHAVAG